MAVTITRTDIRGEMLRRAPVLGRRLTADSITKAGPSLTDVSEYQRQRAGLTSFEGQYINRYLRSDPDRWRLITTLNSGANDGIINVDGPSYADNADLAYERLTVHPDDIDFAIAEGQRRQRVRTNIALCKGGIDLDMETANTNWWGTAAALGGSVLTNATLVKSATTAFSGTQSLQVTGTGANPSTRGAFMRVGPNRLAYFAAIIQISTGPVTFSIWDNTNGVLVGTPVTYSLAGEWVLLFIQATIPATTTSVQYQFSSTAANCLFWVDTCFGPYEAGKTEYDVQTAMNEAYKIRFVRPSSFVAPTQTAGAVFADSLFYDGDLVTPDDWSLEVFRRDLNANRLRFVANSYNNCNVGWGQGRGIYNSTGGMFMQNKMRPIWLAMEAQVSDFEPVLTETATTSQPLDECACYSLRYLAETMSQRDPAQPVWQAMLAEYKMWSVIEDQARPPQAMYTPQRYHAIRA